MKELKLLMVVVVFGIMSSGCGTVHGIGEDLDLLGYSLSYSVQGIGQGLDMAGESVINMFNK